MPIINQADTTTTVNINSDDILYIGADVSVFTTSGYGIHVHSTNASPDGEIYNFGEVVALDNHAMYLTADDTSLFSSGTILAGGQFNSAVQLISADNVTFHNSGLVQSGDYHAIRLSSSDYFTLVNTGTVASLEGYSINVFASDNATIVNHGTITGQIFNQSGTNFELINYGTMDVDGIAYYAFGTLTSSVENHGVMGAIQGSSGSDDVLNTGTLSSLSLGSGNDEVVNAGTITGNVVLSAGYDTFDGRGGTVMGYVSGGADDDTYIIDDAGIDLRESDNNGTDEVRSLVNHTLGSFFENLTLLGAENLAGGGNDLANILTGNSGHNDLRGYEENDTIDGAAGDDALYGGEGNDSLIGGYGNDSLFGGDGGDVLAGGTGDDTLMGKAGNDTLKGWKGDDSLLGGDGNDSLLGADGHDTIYGGTGKDTLVGGDGDDLLTGGLQADTFVFTDGFGNDTIADFASTWNAEKIDLSGVAAITGFTDLSNNHMSQVGSDVVIDDGAGNTITLAGVTLGDLDVNDFLF